MNFIEQLTAVTLLVDFFLGVTFGVVGSAVHGSLREDRHRTLLRQAPDLVSEGAREMLYLSRRDDGYLASLLDGGSHVPETQDERRGDDSGAQGTEPKR
jgi:hypothetical protein